MKNSVKFLYYFFLTVTFSSYCQIQLEPPVFDYNNISLPTSPTGSSLGKYEDISVNMATGIPNINIPIFTLNIDDVNIPISLSYHASGIQVNELSSAVGLNWALNAGGGIFRSVNSLPDEEGWTTNKGPLPDSFYALYPDKFSHNYRVAMLGGMDVGGLALTRDHNPDSYGYNFLGNSGKFIIDFQTEAIKNKADQLEIDFHFDKPLMTDQAGNSFLFGDYKEQSFRRYGISSVSQVQGEPSNITTGGGNYDYGHVTGWLLSKIITKNNKNILFEYEEDRVLDGNLFPISNTISVGKTCDGRGESLSFAESIQSLGLDTANYGLNSYSVQLITKISSANLDINFYYSQDKSLSTWNKKLMMIVIEDKHGMIIKEFHFEYGVFDGDRRLKLTRIYEKKGNNEIPGYRFLYKDGSLPERYSYAQDFFGYYNGKNDNATLAPKDADFRPGFGNFGSFYDQQTGDRSHNLEFLQIGSLKEIFYPTGGSTEFFYEPNEELLPDSNVLIYCGGLRVKRIENKDQAGMPINTKEYQYNGLEGLNYEMHKQFTKTIESGLVFGGKKTYHSGFILPKSLIHSGYFYKEVNELEIGEEETHMIKRSYIDDHSYGVLGHLLVSEIFYKGDDAIKIIEYDYDQFGESRTINWNILGQRECGNESGQGGANVFSTYRNGENESYTGNSVKFPVRIATTDFLAPNKTPVSVIKTMDYDDKTLLKTKETIDTRFTAVLDSNGDITDYSISNPIGEVIETNYKFPLELVPPISNLPKGLPMSKEVFNNGKKVLGQYFEYAPPGNLKNIYRYNKGVGSHNGPSYVPYNYELDVSYLTDRGKPTQIQSKGGIKTSYIWGYHDQYPVVKIENLSYNLLVNDGTVSQIQSLSTADPYNESALIIALNALRTAHPNAQVTTYTYNPLVGISTITDSKGVRVNYIYDGFGRLQYVKDQDGNILSENEYHYKND